jgi:uncharacterized protein (DUF488 family)
MRSVATIGYELTTPPSLIEALNRAGVDLVVDVRAIASSRKRGFAKTALAAALEQAGIEYLHLRHLGTPAPGRAAARAGRQAEMERIYRTHLRTREPSADLNTLADLVKEGRHVCLLCLEASAEHCHRSLVAEALGSLVRVRVVHLSPEPK